MQRGDDFFESLRRSFKPAKVLTLFVGESRPANGTFFYLGNSKLYCSMREAFRGGEDFLCGFKGMGFYLDDLVEFPVNNQPKRLRRKHCRDSIDSLADRIRDTRPAHVVTIGLGIAEHVAQALNRAELSGLPFDAVRFPSSRNQEKMLFLQEMRGIIPKLRGQDL